MVKRAGPLPTADKDSFLASLRQATIGDYEILAELGRGGMAVVYLAHDLALDRKVAIKVMLPVLLAAEGAAERFKREARTAASISHPNVIPIYAVREHEDLLYFVMQFVGGRSLSSAIEQVAPMPIQMVQTILVQVGEALAFGHKRGVVHRDVKPGNILLDEEGRAVVTDFGIAKVATDQSITRTGGVVGTPLYMSPEQCDGDAVTGSSDQYSLGLVAYEMLTGRPPLTAENPIQLMYQRCTESPTPVQQLRRDCPVELADCVMRMLERYPADRWATCLEAIRTLSQLPGESSDSVRLQIAELAKTGHSQRILAQMTTPTSPLPATKSVVARSAPPAKAAAQEATRSMPGVATKVAWAAGITAVVFATWWAVQQMPQRDGTAVEPEASLPAAPPAGAQLVDGFEVEPQAADLAVGDSILIRISGLARDAADPSGTATMWESSDPTVASVSRAGMVIGRAEGVVRVSATAQGHSAVAIVRVRRPQTPISPQAPRQRTASTVAVSPSEGSLVLGSTLTLRASVRDDRGRAIDEARVDWASEDDRVATVSAVGVVTGHQAGTTRIVGEFDGAQGWATIAVEPVPVASIVVRPNAVRLTVGESVPLEALVLDETGTSVASADVWWVSDDVAIATVSPNGIVTGTGPGVVAINGSAQTHRAVSTVTVAAVTTEVPEQSVGEVREEIEAVLLRFAQAVASRDLAAVRRAYPGMNDDEVTAYSNMLPTVEKLDLALDSPLEVVGTSRVATGSAHFAYRRPQTFERTFEYRAVLDRISGVWQLVSIRFQEQ